jgi:hypothetical protein
VVYYNVYDTWLYTHILLTIIKYVHITCMVVEMQTAAASICMVVVTIPVKEVMTMVVVVVVKGAAVHTHCMCGVCTAKEHQL